MSFWHRITHHERTTTMTLRYPDLSGHQHGISLTGATAVCGKATEGTTYTNPDYPVFKKQAAGIGAFFFAYHMLHHGNAAAQAAHCYSVVGKGVGLMVDVEPTPGSGPTITDEAEFTDAYRKLGGTIWLDYLPHWYWQQLGSPSLKPLADRGLLLVSSAYTTYTDADTGTGWQPYGGRTPAVWQYTDKHLFNGQQVDFNAYRGPLADFRSLVLTGKLPAPPPPAPLPSGKYHADGKTTLRQLATRQGAGVPAIWFATVAGKLAQGDDRFGDLEWHYLNASDWQAPMPSGMVLWLP